MPRASDYDLCAFCPRLCRHVCPVAVGSGREAATPTHIMAGVWSWLQGHIDADAAHARAALCTRCGACTAACKLSRPVDDLLRDARALTHTAPAAPALPAIVGVGRRVAVHTDQRPWGPSLALHLGESVATLEAGDHLGERLLDHPAAFGPFSAALRAAFEGRTLVAASIGVLRVAREAGVATEDLGSLVEPPDDLRRAPACGRGHDPRGGQPELLACCGACEPLRSTHPRVAEEVGRDQAARLGDAPTWTPDGRCGAWLREHGATIDDPVSWLLRHHPTDPTPAAPR